MKTFLTNNLIAEAERPEGLSVESALAVLDPARLALLDCLQAAYHFRTKYFNRDVTVHILNNAQNGACPEDCRYCAQAKSSTADIVKYTMKPEAEILAEAESAYKNGADCYCMVFSGTGPTSARMEALTRIIRQIKSKYSLDVCVSAGIVNQEQANQLKAAGLDRLNHNINTSETNYANICTTHSYTDRLNTLRAAKTAGLRVCSGVIIGMGETHSDIIEMAVRLREFKAESIPVNFFIPIPGADIKQAVGLTPEHCLRTLCLFRLMNPASEIRMAAGREIHLRSMQIMGLYAANSLFLQGYLNARGSDDARSLQLIADGGFAVRSETPLKPFFSEEKVNLKDDMLKDIKELRPFRQSEQVGT